MPLCLKTDPQCPNEVPGGGFCVIHLLPIEDKSTFQTGVVIHLPSLAPPLAAPNDGPTPRGLPAPRFAPAPDSAGEADSGGKANPPGGGGGGKLPGGGGGRGGGGFPGGGGGGRF